jgi:uncharacterized protein YdhG (YjbR/CyaY superfamily)
MKTPARAVDTIDSYIKPFPEDTRQLLDQLRSTIRKAAPQATEKISYGMPTFYYNGNLVHFAAFKNHIGFFPTPSAIEAFKKELMDYKTSKGTVQFPMADPLPLKLIARMVKFRVKENAAKKHLAIPGANKGPTVANEEKT